MTDQYWEQQNLIFATDVAWQENLRDTILVPRFYGKKYAGEYEFIKHGDPRGQGGVDTILRGKTLDEKIVRWPRNEDGSPRDHAYTAFALETMSCTVEGRERFGWMKTNTVDYLFYCFADQRELGLDCYMIDFKALQEWFYAQDHEQWAPWWSKQANRTECRVVPILDVCSNVRHQHIRLPYLEGTEAERAGFQNGFVGRDSGGRFVHYCHCGEFAPYGYGFFPTDNKIGTWYCKEHRP